ncbi:hypothetical protein RvY_17391 [Ramazzottius varieornatus]|uniref:Uncharacterized protein n=1 Tax=Ramazzottius varieornatus TaxID=947166 RepID=A0A1D1W2F3_RAMVA|nr:hypothetical protein RvY_17391 [Ramazzottius varieornatus]
MERSSACFSVLVAVVLIAVVESATIVDVSLTSRGQPTYYSQPYVVSSSSYSNPYAIPVDSGRYSAPLTSLSSYPASATYYSPTMGYYQLQPSPQTSSRLLYY